MPDATFQKVYFTKSVVGTEFPQQTLGIDYLPPNALQFPRHSMGIKVPRHNVRISFPHHYVGMKFPKNGVGMKFPQTIS